jgi:hypothetical protein
MIIVMPYANAYPEMQNRKMNVQQDVLATDKVTKEIIDEVGAQLAVDKKAGMETKTGVETGHFQEIKEQLEQVFRQLEMVNEVWVADTKTNREGEVTAPGFNPALLGHERSFNETTLFVPRDRGEKLSEALLSNQINTSLSSAVAGFEVNANQRFQFLDKDRGFSFKIGNKEFLIMYLDIEQNNNNKEEKLGVVEGPELSKEEAALYGRFLDIRNKYGDNPNNEAVKKEVIDMILRENITVPEKVTKLLENDKWFPSKKEVEEAKDEEKKQAESYAVAA